MKANEYIKKYGLVCANIKVAETEHTRSFDVFYFNLKRLVESHELVESRGGLDAAKHELILLQKHLNNTFGYVTIITSEKIENLKQAIADVEGCQ